MSAEEPKYEFDQEFQTKLAAMTVRDAVFMQKCDGLIDPRYFTNEIEATLVALALEHYQLYRAVPGKGSIKELIRKGAVSKKVRADTLKQMPPVIAELLNCDISDRDFVIEEVATFARQRAVEEAIISSVSALEKHDFAKVESMMKQALSIGSDESVSAYDYFGTIKNRSERRMNIAAGVHRFNGISTGHMEIDRELQHRGWGRRELSLLMAPAKGGKSMGLGEFGKNAVLDGHNVLYVTLEVSAEIISDRLDANLADTMMKELVGDLIEVQRKIEKLQKGAGTFRIQEFASGTLKPSTLRRLLDKETARGVIYDMLIIDYADIMAPERYTDNMVENSKQIYLAIRAIAQDYNLAVLSATQSNREGAKKTTLSATDVAEDYNRIRIADLVLGINATPAERAAGEARLNFVANRNGEEGFSILIAQDRSRMKFINKVLGRV